MVPTLRDNLWFAGYRPRPEAKVRVLCFPHAGSSAAAFAQWQTKLPVEIEVCPIEYPGRGSRRSERPFVRVLPLVSAITTDLLRATEKPYAMFGHSMGALIAFELLRLVERNRCSAPVGLFVAGCRGPSLPPRRRPIYALPDDEFISEIKALRGTPDEILRNPEMMQLVLPVLRADMELADTYAYRAAAPSLCRLFTYGGSSDTETLPEELGAWALETDDGCVTRMYPGDHFFLRTSESAVLCNLATDLLGLL